MSYLYLLTKGEYSCYGVMSLIESDREITELEYDRVRLAYAQYNQDQDNARRIYVERAGFPSDYFAVKDGWNNTRYREAWDAAVKKYPYHALSYIDYVAQELGVKIVPYTEYPS